MSAEPALSSRNDEANATYLEHFGLEERPFVTTANPMFAMQTVAIVRSMRKIRNVINERSGFGIVSGEVGTGKTTLLTLLSGALSNDNYRVMSFRKPPGNNQQTEGSILQEIATELRIKAPKGRNNDKYVDAIQALAEELENQGRSLVILIDEAQGLKPSGLRLIQRLLGLQSATNQLIQIILFGQAPEIMDVITTSRSLHSRLSANAVLKGFSPEEVRDMIYYRVDLVGGDAAKIFTEESIGEIANVSRGIPRLVCRVASAACGNAFVANEPMVSRDDVIEVAESMRHELSLGF